jgi:hypothetical protein
MYNAANGNESATTKRITTRARGQATTIHVRQQKRTRIAQTAQAAAAGASRRYRSRTIIDYYFDIDIRHY